MSARLLAVLVVAACSTTPRPSPTAAGASHGLAAIGETFTIDSRILGEKRVINVYLPPDYATTQGRYPVLYMSDGGMKEDFPHVVGDVDVSIKNLVVRPLIVVGIENTDRRHDLSPPTEVEEDKQMTPRAGGSAQYRAFIRDELIPAIDKRYRSTAERALIGESLGGLFAVETLLTQPAMFTTYIAVDPSLWWNDTLLVRTAGSALAGWTAGDKRLYIATANYVPTQEAVAVLLTALRLQAPPIEVTYDPMPQYTHGTIYPTASVHAIRALFAQQAP